MSLLTFTPPIPLQYNRITFHEKMGPDAYIESHRRFDKLTRFEYVRIGSEFKYYVETFGKVYENGAAIKENEKQMFLLGQHKDDKIWYNYKLYTIEDFPELAKEFHNKKVEKDLEVLDG